jgi:D-3-phosphoglycerate dehydrogenase
MTIMISDDYQDCIRTLDCYPRLSNNFEVIIHTDTVRELDQMATRFAQADALILIRERTSISAQLLERLPRVWRFRRLRTGAS